MIEGSQIDWQSHGNNLAGTVAEMLDFDEAVARVLRFARADGETLVIVTADHETGGLGLNSAGGGNGTLTAGWTTGGHTGALVPVFAFGPNAEAFAGLHQNHHLPQLAVQGWGVANFTGFAYDD